VRYLIQLAEVLEGELGGKGRLSWARGEFTALEEKTWPEREFDPEGYLRIKGARQQGRAVLRELYVMRDEHARGRDRPPFKILGNGVLLDLAHQPPRAKRALQGRRGISELVVRRLGRDILAAVKRGLEAPEPAAPKIKSGPPQRRRLDRRGEARLDALKRWRARKARDLDLDPGVFCPNAALEEIAHAEPRTVDGVRRLPAVKPWWCDAFGEELIEFIGAAEEPPAQPDPAQPDRLQPEATSAGSPRESRPKN
jgi:ribonuclease D